MANTEFGNQVLASRDVPLQGFVPDDPEMTDFLNRSADEASQREIYLDPQSEDFDLGGPLLQDSGMPESQKKMEAFAGASLSSDKTHNNSERIKTEFDTIGNSPTLSKITDYIYNDLDARRRDAVIAVVSDPRNSVEDVQEIITNYAALRGTDADLVTEMLVGLTVLDNARIEEDARVQDKRVSQSDRIILGYEERSKEGNRYSIEEDEDTLSTVASFAMLLFPLAEGPTAVAAKEALGGDISPLDYIFIGRTKQDAQEALLALSAQPEKQRQVVELLKEVIEGKADTWLGSSTISKIYEHDVIDGNMGTGTVWADNIFGVVDALGLLLAPIGIAKKVAKITSNSHGGSPAGAVDSANPAAASDIHADVLKDKSGKIGEDVGLSPEDAVGASMPKPWGSDLSGAPASVVETLGKSDVEAADIFATSGGQRLLYETEELAQTQEKAFEYLESITGAKLHVGMSQYAEVSTEIGKGDRGFNIRAIYGSSEDSGWATLQGAKNAGTKVFGKGQPISIRVRDPANPTKHYDVNSEAGQAVEDGEFFVQFDYTHTYDPSVVAVFGENIVSRIGSVPYVGKYLQDAVNRFDDVIKNGALVYTDQASGLEKRLLDLSSKRLLKLGDKSKHKVLEAIEQGYKEERNWGYEELVTGFNMDAKEAVAYFDYRKGQDLEHALHNREVYQSLQRGGYESLYVGGKEAKIFAKKIDESSAVQGKSSVPVYDANTNTTKLLSTDEVSELYAGGNSIARMNSPVYVGKNKFDMVVVGSSPFKGGTSLLKPLSRTPLNYKEGYYQRIYKDPYVVRKVYTGGMLNGSPVTGGNKEAIAFAATKTEADELVAAAVRDNKDKGVIYTAERERGLPSSEGATADWENIHKRGLTSARHRGERLEDVTGLAKIEDPMTALVRSSQALSKRVALGGWFDTMKARWSKTFVDLTDEGRFPATLESLQDKLGSSSLTRKEKGQALSVFEYIKMMEGRPTPRSRGMQNMMLNLAELTEKAPKLSAVIRGAAAVDPLKLAKGSAFISFIAMNPLRHFPLQASQLLQTLAIDPKYLLSGMMFKDIAGISAGMFGMTKGGAKLLGVSEKEFNQVMKQFKATGLPTSMDQHALIESVVTKADVSLHSRTPFQKIIDAPVSAAKGAVQAGKSLGFIPGEFVNLAGHWLVARRRWAKKNPKGNMNSPKAQDEIGLDARQLSWSMNRAGKMGYQGYSTSSFSEYLSIPFQFMSVPHKAFLAMTTSKAYTREEKARLAATNIVLFGGTSLGFMGFNTMLDGARETYNIDLDQETWVKVKGGIVDWGVSSAIDHMMDDSKGLEDQFKLADAMAPTNSLFGRLGEVTIAFWEKPMLEAVGGASGTVGSKIARAFRDAQHVVTANPEDTPEQILGSLEAFASILSGPNNYFKMKYAQKYNKLIDSKGHETVTISDAGASMLGFGISTYKQEAHYKSIMDYSDMRKDVMSKADDWYDSAFSIKARNLSDDDYALELRGLKAAFNLMSDDPIARELFIDRITSRSQRDFKNKGEGFHNHQLERALRMVGDFSSMARDNYMNDPNISEENKQLLNEMLDNMSGVNK